jgi:hypothetical protein
MILPTRGVCQRGYPKLHVELSMSLLFKNWFEFGIDNDVDMLDQNIALIEHYYSVIPAVLPAMT